jgi:hypothetical protein
VSDAAERARVELMDAFRRVLARSGAPHSDVLAAELLTVLAGRGWRYVEAVAPDPARQAWKVGRPVDPGAAARGRALIRATVVDSDCSPSAKEST